MTNTYTNSDRQDLRSMNMDDHIQAARRLRSEQAHSLIKNLLAALLPSGSSFKSRYVLSLTRTA